MTEMDAGVADVNLEQGLIWAYRLLLNREPENADAIAKQLPHVHNAEHIRSAFVASNEYADRYEYAGRPMPAPVFPVDLREGVLWGYRFLLLREPSAEDIEYQLRRVSSVRDIRSIFLFSREFESRKGCGVRDLLDIEVINRFAPFSAMPPEQGFFYDFLGTRTRVSYLPHFYQHKSGTQEGGPNTRSRGMHGLAEWIGTLRSVIEARDRFVAVELGAGWAPWLASSAFAARRQGIDDIRLIGVEASPEHVAFSRQHMDDNGLDADIVHAVVGAEDGIARFPRLIDPSDHYGAHAAFDEKNAKPAPGFGEWDEIRSVSLETLLEGLDRVDILHSDIQGAESDVLHHSIDLLNRKVSRIVVGTHSRKIDGELIELFADHGWILEYELPCVIEQQEDGKVLVIVDGEQVWRNVKL